MSTEENGSLGLTKKAIINQLTTLIESSTNNLKDDFKKLTDKVTILITKVDKLEKVPK